MKLIEWSMSRRIGVSLGIASLLLLAVTVGAAHQLAELKAHRASLLVLAGGGVGCGIIVVVSALLSRGMSRQIGGEPTYATWIANKIATGNLALPIQTKPDDRSSLLFALAAMRERIAGVVKQARVGAEAVASASSELANGNLDISAQAGQHVDSLAMTAAAMEQMTATVEQNLVHVGKATALADAASQAAHRGGDVVAEVIRTMGEINESSKKVVDIIGVIDGIAFQTNILALNAAVEASHAGNQGRGFAVVASEVRALAQRAAEAAREVKALINDSARKIHAGTELVSQAGRRMEDIVAGVSQVTDVIGHIRLASDQQSQGLHDISTAVAQLDQLAQQNAQLVERAAAAAEAMQDQAGSLAQAVSVFKLGGSVLEGHGAGTAATEPLVQPSKGSRKARGYQSRLIRFGYGLEAESNQGRAARFFAHDLAQRTGGKLKVKEVGNASLGNDDQMQEALKSGVIEMMVGSTSTLVKDVADFGVFDLPFLLANEQEADALLDGEFGQALAAKLGGTGLVGLVYWENGFRNISNSRRAIARLEDLQGLRLRVMQNPIHTDMFKRFGATPVPLAFADLFLAMETGQVDGQENPVNTIQSCRFYEVQKHLSLTRHVYSPWIVTASQAWWDTLSSEEQDAVRASAIASREFERRDSRASTGEALAFLKGQGMQVTVVSERELARMRDTARPVLESSAYAHHVASIRRILGKASQGLASPAPALHG